MKLVVQIPCLNEETSLVQTLADIPREIPGVDVVELLIINDGSTDGTVEVARKAGVDHIVSFRQRRGLAIAFKAGLDASLRAGADIIVNTDGDNQYCGHEIPRLIEPILAGRADLVVGDRHTDQVSHFTLIKKILQKWGTRLVRIVSKTNVTDATSGFRAYSREAAIRVTLLSRFSYTLETLLQAGIERYAIETIRVETNAPTRGSRLFKSIPQYLRYSMDTLIRIYTMYNPLRVFLTLGGIMMVGGMTLGLRFIYLFLVGMGEGHIQSLILASILLLMGFQVGLIGLLADVIANNRKLLEDLLVRVKRIEYGDQNTLILGERTPLEEPAADSAAAVVEDTAR